MHIIKQKLMAVTEYIPPKRLAAGAYPSQNKKVEVVSNQASWNEINHIVPFDDLLSIMSLPWLRIKTSPVSTLVVSLKLITFFTSELCTIYLYLGLLLPSNGYTFQKSYI